MKEGGRNGLKDETQLKGGINLLRRNPTDSLKKKFHTKKSAGGKIRKREKFQSNTKDLPPQGHDTKISQREGQRAKKGVGGGGGGGGGVCKTKNKKKSKNKKEGENSAQMGVEPGKGSPFRKEKQFGKKKKIVKEGFCRDF